MLKTAKTVAAGLMLSMLVTTGAMAAVPKTVDFDQVVAQQDGREIEYYKDHTGKIFHELPKVIRTKTASENGKYTIKYDINGISNVIAEGKKKIVDTGAALEVTGIVKEGQYGDQRILYANTPVKVNISTTKHFNKVIVTKVSKFGLSNGRLLYSMGIDGRNNKSHSEEIYHIDGNNSPKLELKEPGVYYITINSLVAGAFTNMINVVEEGEELTYTAPKQENAIAASAKVRVNGKSLNVPAYNINESNYMKIRDIAYMINGTQKEFSISATPDMYGVMQIMMITWQGRSSYEATGAEMKPLAGGVKTAIPSNAKLTLEATQVYPTMYTIDGNNYVKLRDIANIFDFGADFDSTTGEIVVNTAIEYSK